MIAVDVIGRAIGRDYRLSAALRSQQQPFCEEEAFIGIAGEVVIVAAGSITKRRHILHHGNHLAQQSLAHVRRDGAQLLSHLRDIFVDYLSQGGATAGNVTFVCHDISHDISGPSVFVRVSAVVFEAEPLLLLIRLVGLVIAVERVEGVGVIIKISECLLMPYLGSATKLDGTLVVFERQIEARSTPKQHRRHHGGAACLLGRIDSVKMLHRHIGIAVKGRRIVEAVIA